MIGTHRRLATSSSPRRLTILGCTVAIFVAACGDDNGAGGTVVRGTPSAPGSTSAVTTVAPDPTGSPVTTAAPATTATTLTVPTTTAASMPTPDSTGRGQGVPDPAGRIAFGVIMDGHEQSDQLTALYAIDPDGSDRVQLTDGNSAMPSWSPDGTRLAFTMIQPDGSAQIATITADGDELRLLTSGPGIHEAPDWSPDGTWIAYDYSPLQPYESGFHTVLYRMDADGSNQEAFGDPDAFDYEPTISPNGKSVLFQRATGSAEPIMIRDIASAKERTVMPSGGHNPAWAPDGRAIVVQTDPITEGAIWGPLVRVPVKGDDKDVVGLYPGGAESGGFKPVYSPDGNHIAFGCGRDAGTPRYDEAICVMNPDGTDVQVLVDTPGEWDNEVAWGITATG